jgi:hypothetical protein
MWDTIYLTNNILAQENTIIFIIKIKVELLEMVR